MKTTTRAAPIAFIGLVLCTAPVFADAEESDAAEVDQAYEQAFEDFVADRFSEAASGFEDVATRTVDPARRAAAAELAAQARKRAATPAAPVAPAPSPPGATDAATEEPVPSHLQSQAQAQAHASDEADNERTGFLIGTTLLGLGFWGWAPLTAFDIEGKAAVGTYMIVGASSFFVPFLLTRKTPVTRGDQTLSFSLGLGGIGIGAMAYGLATGFDDSAEEKALIGTMAFTSVAGTLAGYAWSKRTNMDAGTASAIGSGLLFGSLWGLGLSATILGEDTFAGTGETRATMGTMLATGALGMAGGGLLARPRRWTGGDTTVISMAGFMGAHWALVPVLLVDADEPNVHVIAAALVAGSVGGLWGGDRLVRDLDLTRGQGALTAVGVGVGWLLGGGITYLISSESWSDETKVRVGVTMTAASALAGGALTYFLLDRRPDRGPGNSSVAGLRFQLVPSLFKDEGGRLTTGLGVAGSL